MCRTTHSSLQLKSLLRGICMIMNGNLDIFFGVSFLDDFFKCILVTLYHNKFLGHQYIFVLICCKLPVCALNQWLVNFIMLHGTLGHCSGLEKFFIYLPCIMEEIYSPTVEAKKMSEFHMKDAVF